MSSVRPLVTITVLVFVGAYLYLKINEGPARPNANGQSATSQSHDGIPPLSAAGGGATLSQESSAPAWPPAESKSAASGQALALAPAAPLAAADSANAQSSDSATDFANSTKAGMPEVPPIPELPDLSKSADVVGVGAPPAAAPPAELPKNIPAANYGEDAGPKLGAAPADTTGTLPALPALPAGTPNDGGLASPSPPVVAATNSTPATSAAVSFPATPGVNPGVSAIAPLSGDRYGTPAESAPAQSLVPPAASTIPPSSSTPTSTTSDRYGPSSAPVTPVTEPSTALATLTATQNESFAGSWPAIQAALDRRDLKEAHQLLSKWHGDMRLSPADSQKVESLLGQLAGTVIYSNEHQLEPPHVVKQGETLETVAKAYNVPWQLLAKINGIQAADQVQPGQELKVVRGPFTAIVQLNRNELTLEVDGRYAGTFPVTIAPGAVREGQWLVEQKLNGQQNPVTPAAYGAPVASDRSIVLRNASAGPTGPILTIASRAPAPGASGATIAVSQQDVEDLSDILSVGSRVVVRK